MSRVNFHNRAEGHRVEAPSNRDLEQKLTYQQLLNLNHDLSKENQHLKNIANRFGQQLRNFHTMFDIKPRDENNELYNAIGTHPILHQYELTLIPLLDAYEAKIQEFENGFEIINQEFINLEKKYIEVSSENERLRTQLTDKIKELVELYQSGNSEKLKADFGQIILAQINEKQKFLTEENNRLERGYQSYKADSQKLSKELAQIKQKEKEVSDKYKKEAFRYGKAEQELKGLKDQVFQCQLKKNEVESEKKKLQNDLQRAIAQVAQLNKDREGLIRNYESLKKSYERDVSQAFEAEERNNQSWQRKPLEETKQQVGQEIHKKYQKAQTSLDNYRKECERLKSEIEKYKADLDEANERLEEIKKEKKAIEVAKAQLEKSDARNKKLLKQFTDKSQADLERAMRKSEEEIKKLEDDHYAKIEAKLKIIAEVEEELDKARSQNEKLRQENDLYTTMVKDNAKVGRSKDTQRIAEKLKEKMAINEELFKQQLQIIENDNTYLKRDNEKLKADCKEKSDEIKRLRQELEKIKKELDELREKHNDTIEDIKRVKAQYEGSLHEKQLTFEKKIRDIRAVVEQSDRRRKGERQKVAEASRQYKRVLDKIKETYEERIRVLESQGHNLKQNY